MQRIEGHSSEELSVYPHLPELPFHRPTALPIRLVLHAAATQWKLHLRRIWYSTRYVLLEKSGVLF